MSINVKEVFQPLPIGASGSVDTSRVAIAGFFCTTGGTLGLREGGASGTIKVNTFTVAAGVFYVLPFEFPGGLYIELGGGAVGTLAVAR